MPLKTTPSFCNWMLKASDNKNYLCGANLAEGLCNECPYTVAQIHVDPTARCRRLYISQIADSTSIGCCQDFDPQAYAVRAVMASAPKGSRLEKELRTMLRGLEQQEAEAKKD